MDLTEVFEQLLHGELSSTIIGTPNPSFPTVIKPEYYPKLINSLNLGVLALHKKFTLIEKEVVIQEYDSITDYLIKWDFALTNTGSSEDPKYIIDSTENPFNTNRPIKITNVYREDGVLLDLNPTVTHTTSDEALAVYTPSPLHLQVPYPVSENSLFLICQAAPNNIPTTTVDLTTEVEIPDILLEPLLAFMADRYFVNMSGNNNTTSKYVAKFTDACDQIKEGDLINKDTSTGAGKFQRNGWK